MRDPRQLGPVRRVRPPSLLDLIQGGVAPSVPIPIEAEEGSGSSVGSRLASLARGAVGVATAPARFLGNELRIGREAAELRNQSAEIANARARQAFQLGEAQLPAEQAESAAQTRNFEELNALIESETDPARREALIRSASGGPFRPRQEFEPDPVRVNLMQNVLGMGRDEAKHALRLKEIESRADERIRVARESAAFRSVPRTQQPLTDELRGELQDTLPDIDFSNARTRGDAQDLIRAQSVAAVAKRSQRTFERLPGVDRRNLDARTEAIGQMRSVGEGIPGFQLGFLRNRSDLAKWYAGLNQPNRAALRTQMQQAALKFMSSIEGGRPSDKDREFYLKLFPSPEDSNPTAFAKLNLLRDSAEEDFRASLQRLEDDGFNVKAFQREGAIPRPTVVSPEGTPVPTTGAEADSDSVEAVRKVTQEDINQMFEELGTDDPSVIRSELEARGLEF